MQPSPRFTYTGTTPGADANVYLLFSTTASTGARSGVPGAVPPANFFPMIEARKFELELKIDQAGTLNTWFSNNDGVTWVKQSTEAIAVPANASVVRVYDIGAARDWKVEWTNGGSAQGAAVWAVGMTVSDNLV